MDIIVLKNSLKMHLGLRTKSYINNNVAVIGVGHILKCKPLYVISLNHNEIEELLLEDIDNAVKIGKKSFREMDRLPENIQNFVVELAFIYRDLKDFAKPNKHLREKKYVLAKKEYVRILTAKKLDSRVIKDLMSMIYDDNIKVDDDVKFNVDFKIDF